MSLTDRRQHEKTNLRQEILDAARRIFHEEGYEALTMRRVAEEIDYSPTTIYLYFKDKAELVRAICDELFEGLAARVQSLREAHPDPLDFLEAGVRAYIEFGLAHPSHYYVAFVGAPGRVDYQFAASSAEKSFEFLRRSVADCVVSRRVRCADAEVLAQTLWMACHGLVTALVTQRSFPFASREALIGELVRTVMRGVKD